MTGKAKSFVMEIGDLQHDRRTTTFEYGEHAEIPVAYNPGAFTREAADREDDQDDATRREAMLEALEDQRAERFLASARGAAYVADPEGLADYLLDATARALRKRRDAIIDSLAAGLLIEWPLTRNGEPAPITREEMLRLPYMFLAALYAAIMEDMSPGKNSSRGQAKARQRR